MKRKGENKTATRVSNQKEGWRGYLSNEFSNKLEKGILHPLIQYIKNDCDIESGMDIQLRDNYINIYYKGGNILTIKPRSFFFDEFYFYIPETENSFRKTHIKYIYDKTPEKISTNTPFKIPTYEQASAIMEDILYKKNQLLEKLPSKYEDYFYQAKSQMNDWLNVTKHEERGNQHKISLANREFSSGNDLVVIDLEFCVSTDKKHHSYANGKQCRFDLICVDKTGQLYVIELKNELSTDLPDKKSNVEDHKNDFITTVCSNKDSKGDFIKEMKGLLKVKKMLGILKNEVYIDDKKAPIFAISFSGKNIEERDKFKKIHKEDIYIDIDDNWKLRK